MGMNGSASFFQRVYTALVLLAMAGGVRGDHYSGGTISYTCLGGNFFTVNLDMYVNCAGVPVGPQTIQFQNQCGVVFQQNNVPLTLTEEVSPLCAAQINSSTCNGGLNPGFRRYRYSTSVFLSPCNFWTISWNICCRNVAENLQNTPGIHVEAILNNQGGTCDNSPRFADNGVPFLCVNAPISYNPGASDPNGNPMQFQLVSARLDAANQVLYRAPYTGAQPITGISINPFSGQLDFTATVVGNYVVVIKVSTFNAAGQLVGSVMRDLLFVVRACSGNPPVANDISNITGVAAAGPSSVAVCQGQTFCVDMVVSDPNPATVINLRSNAATLLPGSTFVVTGSNPAVGRLCWTANLALLPTNIFVEGGDGECPIENVASRSVYINSCLLLPVELVAFEARDQGGKVELSWSTSPGSDAGMFVVERSADGTVFHTIGQLPAAGDGAGVCTYAWTDHTPLAGMNYYRLMIMDQAGGREFSQVVVADRGMPASVRAISHGQGRWTVQGLRQDEVWRAFDRTGRNVAAAWSTGGSVELATPAEAGMVLFAVVRDGERLVLKLPSTSEVGEVLVAAP